MLISVRHEISDFFSVGIKGSDRCQEKEIVNQSFYEDVQYELTQFIIFSIKRHFQTFNIHYHHDYKSNRERSQIRWGKPQACWKILHVVSQRRKHQIFHNTVHLGVKTKGDAVKQI